MRCQSALRLVLSILGLILAATILSTCTTAPYYIPGPKAQTDTLLVIWSGPETVGEPLVDYRVVLENGIRIRVFPRYDMTFWSGLEPGEHRAVAIETAVSGSFFVDDRLEVDIPFVIETGSVTVFPLALAVSSNHMLDEHDIPTVRQTCTLSALDDQEFETIRNEFAGRRRSRQWSDYPWVPVAEAATPELNVLTKTSRTAVQFEPESTCFPAGTPVHTATGPQPIERLTVGDSVVAYEPNTDSWSLRPVTRLYAHEFEGTLVSISAGATLVEATDNHPFWVVNPAMPGGGSWVEAGDLAVGDRVLLHQGGATAVIRLTCREVSMAVFNIEVEGLHTYTVGNGGIAVHNKGSAEP